MPYRRLALIVLDEWRIVERHRRLVGEQTEGGRLFQEAADALRDEYGRLIDEAIEHHRPVPPPFPLA